MGTVVAIGLDAGIASACGAIPAEPADPSLRHAALLLVAAGHFADAVATRVPVLAFAGEPGERAALLDAGAVDAASPCADPIEIAARVRALLRRGSAMRCGDLAVDFADRRAERGGRPIALHPREFAVLAHLARHAGRTVCRASLYAAIWGRDFDPGTNVVAVTVSRLRAKIDGRGPRLIHTVTGGYRLSAVAER